MYAIEALLKEENAERSEVVAQDLLFPLPLMTLKQFLQCENQLEMNINMRKQFISIHMVIFIKYYFKCLYYPLGKLCFLRNLLAIL